MEAFDSPEAEAALREVLVRSSVRAVLSSKSERITTTSFSPDGARILSESQAADGRRSLQLWDTLTGKSGCEVRDASGGRFSTDGLFFHTSDGRTYDTLTCQLQAEHVSAHALVEVGTGKGAKALLANQPSAEQTEVRFLDNTSALELIYQAAIPVIREVPTRKVLRSLYGHQDPIGGGVFSDDSQFGRLLVTWARKDIYTESGGGPTEIGEKVVRVWGVQSGDNDRVLSGHRRAINAVAFGPDAAFVITGSDDRTARVWMTNSGDEFAVLRGYSGPVEQVRASPNGAYILTISDDGTARIWEPGTTGPTKVGMADLFTLHYGIPLPTLQGDELPVDIPVLSADRKTLLAKGGPSRMTVWNAQTGQRRGSASDEEYGEPRGQLSPDGARVVTTTGWPAVVCCSEVARVWDVETGRLIAELGGQNGPVYGAAYSPSGQMIVTYGENDVVRLWNATTFTLVRELAVRGGRVLHAAFSSDGNRLVTASRDSLGRIWDVKNVTGREFFGVQMLLDVAMAYVKHGTRKQGSEKNA
jgi:WD40 repeat protein